MNQLLDRHAKDIARGKGLFGRDQNLRDECREKFKNLTTGTPCHVFVRGRFQCAIPEGGFNRKQLGALKRKG